MNDEIKYIPNTGPKLTMKPNVQAALEEVKERKQLLLRNVKWVDSKTLKERDCTLVVVDTESLTKRQK